MEKRSKVQLYEQIRRAYAAQETKSIRALSGQFRVHRRDVRAALESAVPPPRKPPVRAAPRMDRWKPIIDVWLAEDQKWPRKQRHTARRVWQRLVTEHGADVGESTVRRYVKTVRERQTFPLAEVTVPQHHPLGSKGECDFGEAKVVLAGIPTDVSLFLMRLSSRTRSTTCGWWWREGTSCKPRQSSPIVTAMATQRRASRPLISHHSAD